MCLALSLLALNPTCAARRHSVFPGQWIAYTWQSVENSSGWFPGHLDVLRLSAVSTYFIGIVSGVYQASVEMQGTVLWPEDSVNRSLRALTVHTNGSSTWELLANNTSFDYRHSAVVSQDDGTVLLVSGTIALHASYTYPESAYSVSYSFLQDQPSSLSLYFFKEVGAATGTLLSAWASEPAQVLAHGQLDTRVGTRPAIVLFHNESSSLPPMWRDAEELTLQYDRETNFLLAIRYRIQSWVNITRISQWTMVGDILLTNMYGPQPGLLQGQVFLAVACLGAVAAMVVVSRWMLRGLRRTQAAETIGARPPDR